MFGLNMGRLGRAICPQNPLYVGMLVDQNMLLGLDPAWTFTRSSSATYYDATGTLQTASNNVARLDYGANPGGVTNWIRNSVMQGAGVGVYPTNWFYSPLNSITADVVAFGIESGISYIDVRYQGTASGIGTVSNPILPDSTTSIPGVNNRTYTTSVYFKLVSGSFANITSLIMILSQRNIGGGLIADINGSNIVGSITSSLQRFSFTTTTTATATAYVIPKLINLAYPSGAVIDFTIRIGSPQLEFGSSATTFIPTLSSAVNVGAAPLGILFEEQRQNLLFPSGDLATLLTASNVAFTANQGVAPDNTATMTRITELATTAPHYAVKSGLTITANATCTFSSYVRAQENTFVQLFFDDNTSGIFATFDLSAGTISQANAGRGTGVATGAGIIPLGNGVYRVYISGRSDPGSTSVRCGFVMCTTGTPGFAPTYAGNASNGFLAWGMQLEQSLFMSSYWPTTVSATSRSADVATITGGAPSWYNTTQGTFYVEFRVDHNAANTGSQNGLFRWDDGVGTNNQGSMFMSNGGDQLVTYGISGGVAAINSFPVAAIKLAPLYNKISIAYGSLWRGGSNGNLISDSAASAAPVGITRMMLGASNISSWQLGGHLRRFRYWNRAISRTEMTTLTT